MLRICGRLGRIGIGKRNPQATYAFTGLEVLRDVLDRVY